MTGQFMLLVMRHHNYVNISVPVHWRCKRQRNCFVNKGFSLSFAFRHIHSHLANLGSNVKLLRIYLPYASTVSISTGSSLLT